MYRFGAIEADKGFAGERGLAQGLSVLRRAVARQVNPSRVLDLLIAVAALIFTAPLLIVLALLIRAQDGGPAVFGHLRIGRDGRSFRCFKFRSMVVDSDARLQALLATDPEARREWELDRKLRNDPRITAVGNFLRKSSLDELPQLFNVIRGEMSIVGPRPIVAAEAKRYGASFRQYCSVRPGITGLWQVSGRNNLPYRRRIALDRLYARSKCVSVDLRILILTVPAVLSRNGSY